MGMPRPTWCLSPDEYLEIFASERDQARPDLRSAGPGDHHETGRGRVLPPLHREGGTSMSRRRTRPITTVPAPITAPDMHREGRQIRGLLWALVTIEGLSLIHALLT